jgi:hypothetical protein
MHWLEPVTPESAPHPPRKSAVMQPGSELYRPLDQDKEPLFRSRLNVTGARAELFTNSPEVLRYAREFFPAATDGAPNVSLRFWVDDAGWRSKRWPQPYFRGLGRMAYAGFDSNSSLLINLRRRTALGRFSAPMAADAAYWRRVIFPTLTGLISDALGVTVVHCACVERGGAALLLAGESGAGKSTLSLAMARRGFAFVSDDWTYLSGTDGELKAWGVATPLKLLPDAAQYFPELRALQPGVSLNGEAAFEVEPRQVFGIQRCFVCKPRWVVFLERQNRFGHCFSRMQPAEAARRLGASQGRLPRELAKLRKIQRATIRSIANCECWLLEYGEGPEDISQALGEFCAAPHPPGRRLPVAGRRPLFFRRGPDPTERLTPTTRVAHVSAAGREIRVETDSETIHRLLNNSLPRRLPPGDSRRNFHWRLIEDESASGYPQRLPSESLAADGLQLVHLGRRSFLAVDAEAGCGVGFLEQEYVAESGRFERTVLPSLLALSMAGQGCKHDNDRAGGIAV